MFASSSESNAMLASSSESNALSAPSPQMVNNTARSSQGRFQLCSLRVALSQVASVGEADQQDLEIMRQNLYQYPDVLADLKSEDSIRMRTIGHFIHAKMSPQI